MPGPRNARKKKNAQVKKEKQKHVRPSIGSETSPTTPAATGANTPSPSTTPLHPATPPAAPDNSRLRPLPYELYEKHDDDHEIPTFLPKRPFIEDPGNGPRVRDAHAFLSSSFASPPSLDDPLCAEFAQDEVLQMLASVLPEEIALILWYNKSRLTGRICPACQRLYHLGDVLPAHMQDVDDQGAPLEPAEEQESPHLLREQEISGLCSRVCFILGAFNYPSAIRSTWGRMAEELSDETWGALDAPSQNMANDRGLGMLIKMTRCHDLGLGQLFFPDLKLDDDESD